MKNTILHQVVFAVLGCCMWGSIWSQNAPCTNPPPNGGIGCIESCVYCTLDGLTGNNNTFAFGFLCNGSLFVDRDVWFAFIPATTEISLNVTSSNCQNGDGFQLALLSECQPGNELDCNLGQAGGEGLTLNIASSALVPGQIHYLLIDGYLADICDYSIELVSGAFAVPPTAIAPLDGPTSVCIGQTYTYQIPPVDAAISYTITAPPGASVNGQGNTVTVPAGTTSVTITFGNNTNGQICLNALTTCAAVPPACLAISDCCVADAGTLQPGLLSFCVSQPATFVHNGDENLGPNDLLEFILFTDAGNPLASIVARSISPEFIFDPGVMVEGQTYYIAAIAGLNAGGQVDLLDQCLDISNFIQLIWRPGLTVDLKVTTTDICAGECAEVEVTLEGTPPFELTVNDVYNGDRTFIFNTFTGNFLICPPLGAVPGLITVQAVRLIDEFCTCE